MSDIKKIFLDLDGPLLDSKERHFFCYQSILERFGYKSLCINEYWGKKRARVNRRDLLNMSGAGVIYDAFLSAWMSLIESPEALALDKLQEGSIDCLRSWKQREIIVIMVTMRQDKQALEKQLKRLELCSSLDAVLVCNPAEGGTGKADAVQKMCLGERYSEDALWIGDTEADWEAAKSLGCDVVLLSNGLRTEEYLRTLRGALVKPSIVSLKDEVLGKLNDKGKR